VTYLTLEDLFAMVERMFGTTRMVRDPGLLDASAYRPQATMSGEDLYPTIHLKAAALMESLVCNHTLIDGNKRLAFAATLVYYGLNEWRLQLPHQDAAVDLVLAVAKGEVELHRIADTLESWAQRTSIAPDGGHKGG
jgi:death-on-curing protein